MLQPQARQRIGCGDARRVVGQHLAHRASGLDHPVGRQALRKQVFAGDVAVGQVDVRGVVDDAAVDFLRHAHVEAAVAGFHVEGRDLAALGRDHREATIGVAQHQHRIGLDPGQRLVGGDDDLADGLRAACPRRLQEYVRPTDAQVIEEDPVELVVVVLAGVHQDVVAMCVQRGHHPRQADDLRPGADDGGDLQLAHAHTLLATVSGCCRSKISFAHNITTSSSSPILVMSCAQPGMVSTTRGWSPSLSTWKLSSVSRWRKR